MGLRHRGVHVMGVRERSHREYSYPGSRRKHEDSWPETNCVHDLKLLLANLVRVALQQKENQVRTEKSSSVRKI